MQSEDAQQAWGEAGYLLCADMLDPLVQGRLARGFDDYPDDADLSVGADARSVVIPPAVFALALHPAVIGAVRGHLGAEITLHPMQSYRPAADAEAPGPWQQDIGLLTPHGDETQMLAVWVAAGDAPAVLEVIAGSHSGLARHDGDPVAIAAGVLDGAEAQAVSIPPGAVLLTHPLLARRVAAGSGAVIDLRYQVTGQHTGRAHHPVFIAHSEVAPENALTDAESWQRGWDQAARRLADQPPRPWHRWPPD